MYKHIIILSLLTWLVAPAAGQTGKEWDDPLTTSVNRETAHALSLPMASEADAVKNDMTLSPCYLSLDGKWKFQWVGIPSNAKTEWCA